MVRPYRATLSSSLPYVTTVTHEVAVKVAAVLIAADEGYSQGSSFAITAEARIPGMRMLYLSESSLKRLSRQNSEMESLLKSIMKSEATDV